MKYRRLHNEELEQVEQEFIQFLAANSITAQDWEKLKTDSLPKAEQVIDMFSEAVWDKMLGRIRFLEERNTSELRVYHFEDQSAEVILIRLGNGTINFLDPEHIQKLAIGELDLMLAEPEVLTGSRKYSLDRKMEIFQMMELGAKPCKEVFWRSVKRLTGQ